MATAAADVREAAATSPAAIGLLVAASGIVTAVITTGVSVAVRAATAHLLLLLVIERTLLTSHSVAISLAASHAQSSRGGLSQHVATRLPAGDVVRRPLAVQQEAPAKSRLDSRGEADLLVSGQCNSERFGCALIG